MSEFKSGWPVGNAPYTAHGYPTAYRSIAIKFGYPTAYPSIAIKFERSRALVLVFCATWHPSRPSSTRTSSRPAPASPTFSGRRAMTVRRPYTLAYSPATRPPPRHPPRPPPKAFRQVCAHASEPHTFCSRVRARQTVLAGARGRDRCTYPIGTPRTARPPPWSPHARPDTVGVFKRTVFAHVSVHLLAPRCGGQGGVWWSDSPVQSDRGTRVLSRPRQASESAQPFARKPPPSNHDVKSAPQT